MHKLLLFVAIFSFASNVLFAQLSGTYTIGGMNPDFVTFSEAIDSLSVQGVSSPVIFEVRNGIYNEQLELQEMAGVTSLSTITFQSESGDSTAVVLTFNASFSSNYTLLMNGADWIHFKKITLKSENQTYGRVLELSNSANNNHFENCVFQGAATTSLQDQLAVIYSGSSLDNDNTFSNNVILNGSFSFHLRGANFSSVETGLVIEGNRLEGAFLYGMNLSNMEHLQVEGNQIYSAFTFSSSRGINLNNCHDSTMLIANQIQGFQGVGIHLGSCHASADAPLWVVNNYVNVSGGAFGFGLEASGGAHQKIYHNTVRVSNAPPSYTFYTHSGNNKEICNNIFVHTGGGHAFYRQSTNGVTLSDHNDLYVTNGGNIGYWDGDRATLSDWQTASNLDANSYSINPLFIAADSFAIAQIDLNEAGIPVGILFDIEGDARDVTNPDIGCDEFDPLPVDAGVSDIFPAQFPFPAGQQLVQAVLKNFGADPLTSTTLHWQVNGVVQTSVNWTGNLPSGDTTTVDLHLFDFPINQAHELTAWTTIPNGISDPLLFNDTASTSNIYAALVGTYTLGGFAPDFINFTAAANNLNFGGVMDSVIFNVRNGTYNETLALTEITGVDSLHKVTFQSESGDSSQVVLTVIANQTNNFTCQLDGTDWLHLKKMTLEAQSNSYGRVLVLQNNATNNRFEHCLFRGIATTSANDNFAVIFSPDDGNRDEYNVFLNNTILNGSVGIHLLGDQFDHLERGIVLEGNKIENCFIRGIYLWNMDAPFVKNNIIKTISTFSSTQGIYLSNCYNGMHVTANQILGFQFNGLYLTNCLGVANEPILVANNFVKLEGTTNGNGIYSSGDYHQIYHNTVHVTNTNAGSTAFETQFSNDVDVVNNIFVNLGGGYAIHRNSNSTFIRSDHNDLYTTGSNLGFWNGNRADLVAWVAASTLDSNSISIDPFFIKADAPHISNVTLDSTGFFLTEVLVDIDGEVRDTFAPDMGADEFFAPENDAAVFSVDSPVMLFAADFQPIYVTIYNNGKNMLTSLEVNWAVNGIVQPTFFWADSLPSTEAQDSICLGNFLFDIDTSYTIQAWASKPNGVLDGNSLNDTARVENLHAALDGIYTIGGMSPDFTNFTKAVAALENGGVLGEVLFLVRDGVYDEQISVPSIAGADSTHTITFRSESEDSTAVTLQADASQEYTLRLEGADWMRFEKMTFKNTVGNPAYVIWIRFEATNNRFENNEMIGSNNGSIFESYSVIYSSSQTDNYNVFLNNHIINGSYGFNLNGAVGSSYEEGTILQGNILENQRVSGIRLFFHQAPVIAGNTIHTNSTWQSYQGIQCSACKGAVQIVQNKLEQSIGIYGINLQNSIGMIGERGLIANNFVSIAGNIAAEGIRLDGNDYQNIYYNNVHITSTNPGSRGLYMNTSNNNVTILNNIFSNTGGGYAFYNQNGNSITLSDYNDLYSSSGKIGYWSGSEAFDLSTWQGLSGQDANSLSIDPLFVTATDLHVSQIELDRAGTPLPAISEDIDGDLRDLTMPDIGADEVVPIAINDAGVVAVVHPNKIMPFAVGNQSVEVVIRNNGADTIMNATVRWFLNEVEQTPFQWTGFLDSGDRDTVVIGNFDALFKTGYDLLVHTDLPNGMTDSLMMNDTTLVTDLYAGLGGTYTIGGIFPDFSSFSEAATILNLGGVVSAVEIDIRNGFYMEQLVLNKVRGTSSTNTLTFQSESGDSSLVKLTRNVNTPNYTVFLNGTDHVVFKDMTLESSFLDFPTVVQLGSETTNLQFLNNRIIAPSSFSNDLIKSSNSLDDTLIFKNNVFVGGGYAMVLLGQHAGSLESGVVIENNVFELQKRGGLHLNFLESPIIRGNQLSGQGGGSPYFGAYLYHCDLGTEISKNKLTHLEGDSYGIYFDHCVATANAPNLIANNFVHTDGTGVGRSLFLNNCQFQHIYHNNIHIANSHPNSVALYSNGGSDNQIKNNIFANSGGGYALYAIMGTGSNVTDYNGLYATGMTLAHWNGIDAANLSALQLLNGMDANSVEANPLFWGADDLHVLQVALDSVAMPLSDILDDIDGDGRNITHPDIGADEFEYLETDVGVIALIAPASACEIGNATTVKIAIQNYGGLPQTGFDVAYSLNGGAVVVENIGNLVVEAGDTAHFTFSAMADLSAYGLHDFDLETQFVNDLNANNDHTTVIIENAQTPALVTNMLPADGTTDLEPTINFSWFPSTGATRYDLYLWHDTLLMPSLPTATDLTQITYVNPINSVVFGQSYKWKVVAKNDYCVTESPVQMLTIKELTDLVVTNISVPISAFSEQEIQIMWETQNLGPGGTGMTPWIETVYVSPDSFFQIQTATYLGGVSNVTALNAGESYTNSLTGTLPQGIFGDYYITINVDAYQEIDENDKSNNRGISQGIDVTLTPPPDLRVTSILTPNNVFSGQPMNVTWVISNAGNGDMQTPTIFHDRISITDGQATPISLATHGHFLQLAAGETDTITKSVTLPNGIFGDYLLEVETDIFDQVFEQAFEDNNFLASNTFNVILTPPIDLVITEVIEPDSANNKEIVTLQWTVQNQGGSTASNLWVDRVYISTQEVFHPDSVVELKNFLSVKTLMAGESYTQTKAVDIPSEYGGWNYVFIEADAFNNIYEHTFENNNVNAGNDSIFVKNADLVVANVTVADTTNSGQNSTVQWTVKNQGLGDVLTCSWKDKIFLSMSANFDPMTATLLDSVNYNTSLLAGDSLFKQKTVVLPNGISGNYFIHIVTDYEEEIFEYQQENNNVSQALTTILLTPWADLRVALLVGLPDTTIAGSLLTLNHTVENFGTGIVQSSGWKDKIFISANPVWTPSEAVLLKTKDVLQPVSVGGTYTTSTNFNIPMLGNNASAGVCYIYVYTDHENEVYEHSEEGNNVLRSNPIFVFAPDPVDFELLNATTFPDTVTAGQTVNLQWVVQNIGSSTALWNYALWYDGVYLCEDSIWHPSYEDFVEDFTKQGPIDKNENYGNNQFVDIPPTAQGDYYAFIVADHLNYTQDGDTTNNVRRIYPQSNPMGNTEVKTIHIKPALTPDLQANTFTAPPISLAGQPIQVIWKVTNTGVVPTSGTWTDKIYLSTNTLIEQVDLVLGIKPQTRTLAVNDSYEDTLTVIIPSWVIGNFVLIFKTDANHVLFEANGEMNNTFLSYLTVIQPPPSDLVISNIFASNMAMVGEDFSIDYTMKNEGTNPATGVLQDLLYFSIDSVLDASDAHFGMPLQHSINLAPEASTIKTVIHKTPGLPLGEYFIIGQTDILDNIIENDNDNNIYILPQKVLVTVPELLMNVPTQDTLEDEQALYYRLEIPDSLEGETLLLTLDAMLNDATTELYLRFDDVPTRANHDFKSSDPFVSDQEIIVPTLQKGTYYLLAYGNTVVSNNEQEIELHAQIIEFSIRDFFAKQGGNTGNVTIQLDGAKFETNMIVRLEDPQLGIIEASKMTSINSTRAYATFPLGGAVLGIYDLVAEKMGGEIAIVADGFEVIAGGAGGTIGGSTGGFFCNIVNVGVEENLNMSLQYPSRTRGNRLVPMTIQFGNSGTVDVECPIRYLISLEGAPLSFDPNDFSENKQEVLLEFAEPNGPPGILRPGISSSITVYSFSSRSLLFVLK